MTQAPRTDDLCSCEVEPDVDDQTYVDDDGCPCGLDFDHVHCHICGGVTLIG